LNTDPLKMKNKVEEDWMTHY